MIQRRDNELVMTCRLLNGVIAGDSESHSQPFLGVVWTW